MSDKILCVPCTAGSSHGGQYVAGRQGVIVIGCGWPRRWLLRPQVLRPQNKKMLRIITYSSTKRIRNPARGCMTRHGTGRHLLVRAPRCHAAQLFLPFVRATVGRATHSTLARAAQQPNFSSYSCMLAGGLGTGAAPPTVSITFLPYRLYTHTDPVGQRRASLCRI